MARNLTRTSTTKLVPSPSDLEVREQGYSFLGETLHIKYPDGTIHPIGGKKYVDMLEALNKLPVVQAALRAIADTEASITGNIMSGATDPEGGVLSLVAVTYNATTLQFGVATNTTYGTMSVTPLGVYTFVPNNAARALSVGQTGTVNFGVTVVDEAGGRKSGTYQITITGTNQGPVLRPDSKTLSAGETVTGNVLANDVDYEGQTISVVSYTVAGLAGTKTAGQTTTIPAVGSFSLSATGVYSFVPLDASVSGSIGVTYTGTDGTTQSTGTLNLSIAPPPPTDAEMQAFYASYKQPPVISRPAPNPVVGRPLPDRTLVIATNEYAPWNYTLRLPNQLARPANAYDFEVGVGKPYTDIDQVPWQSLLPGDKVFIHARPTPYKKTVVISSAGTPDAWIEVIGVRDPVTGAMPVFDGDGAICTQGDHADYADGAAMFAFVQLNTGAMGMVDGSKPRYVHVTGFEIRNAHPSKSRTNKQGVTGPWGEFGAAFYGIGCDNICIQGNEMHNCGLGIFVNSILAERFQSRYLHICNNYIYQCSAVGSYGTHSTYTESISCIYEHNYIKAVVAGSNGDTVKERSSGIVFRYNYVETSANALALRDPSSENGNQNGWLEAQAVDSFGALTVRSAFVYGNTFVNRRASVESIIAIGDGAYQEYREGSLYFYNNVVLSYADGVDGYVGIYYDPLRISLFGLPSTRSPITVVARNNLFYTTTVTQGAKLAPLAIFTWQGIADWSSNWINRYVNTGFDTNYAATLARGAQYTGTGLNGLVESTDSPGFVSLTNADYDLLPGSPYFGLNAALPAVAVERGLVPTRRSILYPFGVVPVPTMLSAPVITGSTVQGNLMTVSGFGFSPLPTSYQYKWYRNGVQIAGATSATYTTVVADAGTALTAGVLPIGAGGSGTEVISNPVNIATASAPLNTTPPVVSGSGQVTFAHTVNTGSWTNSPVSYSYQVYLDGVVVSGETTNSFTPVSGDIGKVLSWRVGATNAGGETGYVMSNSVTLSAVSLDPDNTGLWNFAASNNTTVRTLSTKWNGVDTGGYGFGYEHFTCQNGALQCTSVYGNYNRTRTWYENGQGENTTVTAVIRFSSNAFNNTATIGMQIGLRQTAGQYYGVGVTTTGVFVVKNGSRVSGRTDMTLTSPATLRTVHTGAVIDMYVNGTLALSYTDDTPLTGGFPGVISHKDGNAETDSAIESWTDTP